MDNVFWQTIASLWVSVRSTEEREQTRTAVDLMFNNSIAMRQQEKSLIEELLFGIELEDDDDGY